MDDNDRKAVRQTPWEGATEREGCGFGQWLQRERKGREISLAEIADVTKISRVYLEALESERFDALPATVFAKGFLREYAKYVGLDPDEAVNSFLTALQEQEPETEAEEAAMAHRSSFEWTSGLLLAVTLVVLLGVIGFVGFWAERSQGGDAPPVEPAAESVVSPATVTPELPSASAVTESGSALEGAADGAATAGGVPVAPAATDEPAAALVVTIDFTEDCWVEAAVDGRRRLSELHVQGESLQIDAERLVELTLGNPGGVSIEVNGEAYALEGYRPDRVARDIRIELEESE